MSSKEDFKVHVIDSEYPPMSKEDLNKLADDVYAGHVFGTWNLRQWSDATMVFMPLALMHPIDHKVMLASGTVHLYEDHSKAAQMAVNGMPMFFSFRPLTKGDAERLNKRLDKIKVAMAALDEDDD